jgi:cytochrome P450
MPVDQREDQGFFLNDPRKLDDPFPDLQYFRENRPVFYYAPLDQWFIFGFEDVRALFHDPRLSADRMKSFVDAAPLEVRDDLRKVVPFLETWVLMTDGAAHTRLRALLNLGFSVDAVQKLTTVIRQAANELLDRVQSAGRMDVSGDYGFLLPAYVLSDFMGVHKADRDRVVQWSVDFVDFFNVIPITTDTTQRLLRSATEMAAYTRSLLAERRREPRDDFLGVLANAQATQGGITDDEIVGNAMLLLLAGHVAVRNLIGNVVWLLLTHPDQRTILQDTPTLLPNAVEETLRVEPPVTLIPRIALEDFEFQGNAIRRGQIVQLSIASANRDAAHFPDPDRFDVRRTPAQILSFGYGSHGCLGGHLAREETRIALETLFARLPGLRLDETRQIEWYRNAGNRGPITLPVVF